MKFKFLLFIFLFFLTIGRGFSQTPPACTPAFDGTAPTVAAVSAAYAAASEGNVICLAAGTMTGVNRWTSQVTLGGDMSDKCVEIRGHGAMPSQGSAGETIIEVDVAGHTAMGGYERSGSSCTIDNIRFVFNENDAAPFAVISWSSAFGAGKPWIIHHNDFWVTGRCDQPKFLEVAAHGGIVYRNYFKAQIITDPQPGCAYQNTNVNGLDHIITDDGSWWSSASTMGSADTNGATAPANLYIEKNIFEDMNVAIDQNTSSRAVWRFNDMHNASLANHGYDSSTEGFRHGEVYNNIWTCDQTMQMSSYVGFRGGTVKIFGNTFPAYDITKCGYPDHSGNSPVATALYKLIQCDSIGGWPGSYPDTYPMSHQVGWGWKAGTHTITGTTSTQDQPGLLGYPSNGFQQDLEPSFIFENTNNTGNPLFDIASGYIGTCRAMAYSNFDKGGGAATSLVIPNASSQSNPYVNVGQEAVVVFSDLVGGSTPTITDSLGNTWSSPMTQTNGSERLTEWHSHITTGGATIVITIHFGSSTAARAGTLVVMRGMTATPVDKTPAIATDNASPYQGPLTNTGGDPAQTNEIVLGFYGLNGPLSPTLNSIGLPNYAFTIAGGGSGYTATTGNCDNASATTGGSGSGLTVYITGVTAGAITSLANCLVGTGYVVGDVITVSGGGGNATATITVTGDIIAAGSGDIRASSCDVCAGFWNLGFNGTSGSTPSSNTIVGVTYRSVSDVTGIQPSMTDSETRNGLAGTITFKVTGNDNKNLDLQTSDFIQLDREVFNSASGVNTSCPTGSTCTPFNGTTGTGWGPRSLRPTTCTFNSTTGVGVGYWSTDQGSWNLSGSGGQGVLDLCTATNTWTDAAYVPFTYPNPLANIPGGGSTPTTVGGGSNRLHGR